MSPDEFNEIWPPGDTSVTRQLYDLVLRAEQELHECEQTAARALNYPRFSDDQKNFPGAEGDERCVGEHTPSTIVEALADVYATVKRERDEAYAEAERLRTQRWLICMRL